MSQAMEHNSFLSRYIISAGQVELHMFVLHPTTLNPMVK